MKFVGDEKGIEALKSLREEQPDFIKFLVSEATTSSNRSAEFKSKEGVDYAISYNPAKGELDVQPL